MDKQIILRLNKYLMQAMKFMMRRYSYIYTAISKNQFIEPLVVSWGKQFNINGVKTAGANYC